MISLKPENAYFDVYYRLEPRPVFCYRSGLAVYEETLFGGVLISGGWNAAGYPLDVLSNYPTRLDPGTFYGESVFNIDLNGQSIDHGLKFIAFDTVRQDGRMEAVLTLESGVFPARLKIHTFLDGTQMFERFIEIENLSKAEVNLSRLCVWGGGVETMDRCQLTRETDVEKLYSAGYFDSDTWGREGAFSWHDLSPGVLSVDTRFGRDRFRHPAMFLRNNVKGTVLFSQIGWSGGCRFSVDYNADEGISESRLAFKAEITSYNPMTVLAPGETFTSPEVHMGVFHGDLDGAVNEMHAHIRKSVISGAEGMDADCAVGAGMGAEHDMSVETTKSFMRQFAQMGAEVFIVDAGWACPPAQPIEWGAYNGVNEPNPERYPNGLAEISDCCRELGMKFAMWVEIERLGEKCGVFKEHPEWIAKNVYGGKNGGYIDLTVPEAACWAERELSRIIEEYGLDLLRVDYNVSCHDYFAFREIVPGRQECLSLRHFNAVYRLYRNMKRRFPKVVFENCAGGGGRTDLGMMRCFNHTWVSDWQKAPRSVLITNGMTMVLPPERVDRLFAGMGCHEFGSLDLQMRNTMLTHMSLNVVAPALAEPNPVQMEFIRHSVDIYRNFIRGFLPEAKVFHHTPETDKALRDGYSVLEISAPDGMRGAAAVFALSCAPAGRFTVVPRGVDPSLNYKVTLDNSRTAFSVSGYELMTKGLGISIPSPMSSELILYEAES